MFSIICSDYYLVLTLLKNNNNNNYSCFQRNYKLKYFQNFL